MNTKYYCQKCNNYDYLSTVDGVQVCATCAASAFLSRMPADLKNKIASPE